jgi:hypothetical protein
MARQRALAERLHADMRYFHTEQLFPRAGRAPAFISLSNVKSQPIQIACLLATESCMPITCGVKVDKCMCTIVCIFFKQ